MILQNGSLNGGEGDRIEEQENSLYAPGEKRAIKQFMSQGAIHGAIGNVKPDITGKR